MPYYNVTAPYHDVMSEQVARPLLDKLLERGQIQFRGDVLAQFTPREFLKSGFRPLAVRRFILDPLHVPAKLTLQRSRWNLRFDVHVRLLDEERFVAFA